MKRTRNDDLNVQSQVPCALSLVSRLVQRCQGNCGVNLKPSDNEDYLVVKSHGSTTFIVNGEEKARSGPQYVHFYNICLKEYAYLKHNTRCDQLPLNLITIDTNTLQKLSHVERTDLTNFGITILDE